MFLSYPIPARPALGPLLFYFRLVSLSLTFLFSRFFFVVFSSSFFFPRTFCFANQYPAWIERMYRAQSLSTGDALEHPPHLVHGTSDVTRRGLLLDAHVRENRRSRGNDVIRRLEREFTAEPRSACRTFNEH